MRNLRRKGGAFYYDHGGKPRRWEPLGTDEAVAIRKAKAIAERANAKPGTVDAMLKDRLAAVTGKVAPLTLVNYRIYARHLGGVFGYMNPADITQADILQYLEDCPRMSFRGEVHFLSSAYAGWMKERRLTFNPCFGVRTTRKGSKRNRQIEHPELDAIIRHCDERIAVAIELLYATGRRIGELCNLRWSDVGETTQTSKRGAPVKIERTPELDALLARAKALQANVASLYVICGPDGAKWKTGQVRSRWDTACRRAGVDNAHMHDIRARAGSDVEAEGGLKAAQSLLGHKNPRTTEIYLRDKRVAVVRPLARKKA